VPGPSGRGTVNGIDLAALRETSAAAAADPGRRLVRFRVATDWKGQTRSETRVETAGPGGELKPRDFTIAADEPIGLFGSDSAPNPQELLLAAVNSCLVVGYVAQAALRGVALDLCRIETEGELDLRGFLGVDETVPAGCRRIVYTVSLEGGGSRAQHEEIHQAVMATSPNHFNLSQPLQMVGRLA
jgi:uncharacterized OsmC-like protein